MVLYVFDKKTSNVNIGTEVNSENKELAEELHIPITTKSEKQKVHSSDLADTVLLRKFNPGF